MNKYIVIAIFIMIIILGGLSVFAILDRKEVDKNIFVENEVNVISEELNEDKNQTNENVEEKIINAEENSVDEKIKVEAETCSIDGSDSCPVEINDSENSEEEADDVVEEKEISKPVVKWELAPDFELTDLNGGKVKLSDYQNEKPVIVEFWTSWCHNCQREMPKLQKKYKRYNDKFEIIGVNLLAVKDNEKDVRNFVKRNNITFPIVFDESPFVALRYDIKATNAHFLINTDGTIYDILYVDLDEKKLQEFLKYNGID